MPRVGFEPTILEFEREKKVHILDSRATVIGAHNKYGGKIFKPEW
jgi:hypothetical protein